MASNWSEFQDTNNSMAQQQKMYEAQIAALQAQQAANPRPEAFTFNSPLNQSTWSLAPQLQMNNADSWKKSALGEQKLEQQNLMQNAKQQAGTGIAQAQNNLAMRGGLSSGARERTAMQGQRNLMGANSQVGLAGAQARAQIGTQAQGINMQDQQFNISNVLGQNQASNQAALEKYKTQMAGWAGKEYANAQRDSAANSGGK